MKKRQIKGIKGIVFVLSLLLTFALPCVSFATTFSDIQTEYNWSNGNKGNYGNNLKNHKLGDRWRQRHQKKAQPTPIPAAAWLLGTGLVGLLGIRRKLQK